VYNLTRSMLYSSTVWTGGGGGPRRKYKRPSCGSIHSPQTRRDIAVPRCSPLPHPIAAAAAAKTPSSPPSLLHPVLPSPARPPHGVSPPPSRRPRARAFVRPGAAAAMRRLPRLLPPSAGGDLSTRAAAAIGARRGRALCETGEELRASSVPYVDCACLFLFAPVCSVIFDWYAVNFHEDPYRSFFFMKMC
jgi:hypothetical protein